MPQDQGAQVAQAEKKKRTISEESAQEQMQEFLDYYDIDARDIEIDQGEESVETVLNRLIRAIQKGYLEVDMSGGEPVVTQNLQHPPGEVKTLVYGVIQARHKIEMDKASKDRGAVRMHALMSALSGEAPRAIQSLQGVDMSIMERLATLFMVI